VGPRAVLDVVVKREIPSPRRELNPIQQYQEVSVKAHGMENHVLKSLRYELYRVLRYMMIVQRIKSLVSSVAS
jgi:hypothetical protein